jgi:hypothetical protein
MIDIEDLVPPARPRSQYRCREHPSQSVTWRGRGCPSCPQKSTKAARRAERKKVEQADQIEWTQ